MGSRSQDDESILLLVVSSVTVDAAVCSLVSS